MAFLCSVMIRAFHNRLDEKLKWENISTM